MRKALVIGAVFVGVSVWNPAMASATWDIEEYDACVERERARYFAGDVTTEAFGYGLQYCCAHSGGTLPSDNGTETGCQAGPAVAASPSAAVPPQAANPDVPEATASTTVAPPTKPPKTTFTPGPLLPNLGN